MGMQLDPTPAMGEWSVEVRRESFYLYSTELDDLEFAIADIPKIRAALDQVEQYVKAR